MREAGDLSVPSLTKACMADESIRRNGKSASEFAKKVAIDFSRSEPSSSAALFETDELALLESASGFLSRELGFGIEVLRADAEGVYDPQNKARQASPGRPAILLE